MFKTNQSLAFVMISRINDEKGNIFIFSSYFFDIVLNTPLTPVFRSVLSCVRMEQS